MSKDLSLYENASGGELVLLNNDLNLTESLYQQVYILLFGGNVEANTTGSEKANEQRKDWWGNSLFFSNKKEKQFNSNTERVLDSVALNTSGRIEIQRAVETDLQILKNIANLKINVLILTQSIIKIEVYLTKPGSTQGKKLQYIWDNSLKEVIIQKEI